MSSVFTKIIKGEIPCHKLAEDEHFIAFLDIQPIRKGHALVVPKAEQDYIFDQEDEVLAKMLLFAKPVALAIEACVPCERMGLSVIGIEVPHTHLHLVPIAVGAPIDFRLSRAAQHSELEALASLVRGRLGMPL
jgi:histidine triad (HIT) family protein